MTRRAATLLPLAATAAALALAGCPEGDTDAPDGFVATRAYPGPCIIRDRDFLPGRDEDVFLAYDETDLVSMKLGVEYEDARTWRHEYTYDVGGALLQDDYVANEGGVETARTATVYSYADGLLDVVEVLVWEDGALAPQRETRYFYGEGALLVRTETTAAGDGALIASVDYIYGEAGRLEMARYAWFYEGIEEEGYSVRFSYGADGRVALEEYQTSASSVVNLAIAYTYRADGLLAEREEDGRVCMCPGEVDGVVEERYVYAYDVFGNLLAITRDGDDHDAPADGAVDGTESYSYACWEP